jgi:hypothetical protein
MVCTPIEDTAVMNRTGMLAQESAHSATRQMTQRELFLRFPWNAIPLSSKQ